MDDKVKCKYLGEHSGDCWLCSGNIFQMCMYSNKKECLLLKNEQRKDKINELEQQNLALKQKLKLAVEALHKMHSFEYDNYGMYDDDFEEQRDWLLDIACKALTKIGEVE